MTNKLKNTPAIHISKGVHHGQTVIICSFDRDYTLLRSLKTIPTLRYSKTLGSWYIPYNKEAWAEFIALDLNYTLNDSNIINESSGQKSHHLQSKLDSYQITQKIQSNQTDQPGTASSPIESDIASIATHYVAHSVHPSYGDSKGTDIHSAKSGRSIQYSGGNFYITIYYNDDDIRYLKGLKGYWQSKIKKWIVKATSDNVSALQNKYEFWDHHTYDKINTLILNVECPYWVTLYRTPEMTEIVIVEIAGHKANTNIIKRTTDRCYQKDEKRWTIPNDQVIIDLLIADYIKDGATVINRLPQEDFDYHKKEESYGQFKSRYLLKTETELKPIVERYLDTLIAFKRSKKTMTTYLGPFIKFVKHVGIDAIEELTSKDIDKYMSLISSQKVSDGFLHNAYNAIIFYYRDVLRKNEKVVKEAKRPKKDDSLPTILSLGEVDRILRALDNLKHTTILYTFYSSGIRLGEILNLRVEDMWWERNQIFIKNGKVHPVGFPRYNLSLFFKYILPLPDFRYFSRLVASC